MRRFVAFEELAVLASFVWYQGDLPLWWFWSRKKSTWWQLWLMIYQKNARPTTLHISQVLLSMSKMPPVQAWSKKTSIQVKRQYNSRWYRCGTDVNLGTRWNLTGDSQHRMQENLPTFLLLTLILKNWNVICGFAQWRWNGRPNVPMERVKFTAGNPFESIADEWNQIVNEISFSVHRFGRNHQRSWPQGNFISWADGIKLEKLSVLFWLVKSKERKLSTICFLKKRFANQMSFSSLLEI